ncbi:MAG TPA: GNAT family N-acetyltransferase [Gemmatimonadaceae bacterium]|nr:GNAT family N-acetyltransferase [Gemmatimonadaceae bacterium]
MPPTVPSSSSSGDAPQRLSRLAKYWRDIASFPRDAGLMRAREGWSGVAKLIVGRTMHRVYYRKEFLFIEQQLADLAPRVPIPADVRVGLLDEHQLEQFQRMLTERQMAIFRRRLATPRRCHVVWVANEPAGYVWASAQIEPLFEGFAIDLPPRSYYGWDLYIAPRWRRRGLASLLTLEAQHRSREKGWVSNFRLIAPENIGSLRTLERTSGGYRIHAVVRRTKMLHRESYSVRPYVPSAEARGTEAVDDVQLSLVPTAAPADAPVVRTDADALVARTPGAREVTA